MPALELKTNVKLEDPKAFLREFSTVSVADKALVRDVDADARSVVLRRSPQESTFVHLCVLYPQRIPRVGRHLRPCVPAHRRKCRLAVLATFAPAYVPCS